MKKDKDNRSNYSAIRQHILDQMMLNPNLDDNKLVDKIYAEGAYNLSKETIRKIIDDISSKPEDIAREEEEEWYEDIEPEIIKEEEKYQIDGDNFVWQTSKGLMVFGIEFIDTLFYCYSKHGRDMSSVELRNVFDLTPTVWHSIKRTFELYKMSDIFSPYTMQNTPDEKLKSMIDERMKTMIYDKRRIVVDSYKETLNKESKKVIDKVNRKIFASQTIVDLLSESIPKLQIEPKLYYTSPPNSSPEHIVVSIADLHIGASVQDLKVTRNYSTQIVVDRLLEVANIVNGIGAKKVTLAFLGDFIESFSGLNHINSWQGIEYGMHGTNVVTNALEIIEKFLSSINNLDSILGVAGNHDRASKDNKEDVKGQVAELIFYFLKRIYGEKIPIEFDSLVLSKDIDGIQYILTHGHHRLVKDPKEMVINYGKNDKFNVILSGHLHTRITKADSTNYRHLYCPSIFSGNYYSESNGWTSNPGFITSESIKGKIKVTDYSL